jgi:hypothetical protein
MYFKRPLSFVQSVEISGREREMGVGAIGKVLFSDLIISFPGYYKLLFRHTMLVMQKRGNCGATQAPGRIQISSSIQMPPKRPFQIQTIRWYIGQAFWVQPDLNYATLAIVVMQHRSSLPMSR